MANIFISLVSLTASAAEALRGRLAVLDLPHAVHQGEWLWFRLPDDTLPKQPGAQEATKPAKEPGRKRAHKATQDGAKATQRLFSAIVDGVYTLRWLVVRATLYRGDVEPSTLPEDFPGPPREAGLVGVLKAVSLFMVAVHHSGFVDGPPAAHMALPEAILSPGLAADDLIRLYGNAKVATVIRASEIVAIDPLFVFSVARSEAELDGQPEPGGESRSPDVAPKSQGVDDIERVLVLQFSAEAAERAKLHNFLSGGHWANGFYLNPLHSFEKLTRRMYQHALREGFFEVTLLVRAGISAVQVVEGMKSSGALKREMVQRIETGHHDGPCGLQVRVSEWKHIKERLYRRHGSAHAERLAPYMAVVERIR